MKKLMLFVATACAVGMVQAAAVAWSATNVYAGNSTDKANGVVGYLFLADQVTVAQAEAALAAGGAELTTLLGKGLTPETSTSAGKFTASSTPSTVADSYGGSTAKAFAVIFNTSDPATATSYFITAEKEATIAAVGTTTFAFGTQATASQAAWSPVAGGGGGGGGTGGIPEPTSGLLLLVGGAMLALRRRRA